MAMTVSPITALCSKHNLFEARIGGYHVYRIPGIVVTRRGTVVAYCEARLGNGGDWDPIDICMRRSVDDGMTWDEPTIAMDHRQFGSKSPVNNFVCTADQGTGDVHVLFCNNYARVFAMKSEDDCLSFSQPRDVTHVFEPLRQIYPFRVIAVGPGHGIQLRNGRLIVPVWMSDGSGTEFGAGKLGHRPSEVASVFSDDHGETWQAGDFVVRNEPRFRNPNETCAVELSDGRVLFNTRTESVTHRRLITTSTDGATNWSAPRFDDELLEPICMGSIVSLHHGHPVVFANPGVLERTMAGGPGRHIGPDERGRPFDRKQLTIRLSEDDCQTWSYKRQLEDGPSGYSDLAVLTDGTLLCLYECGVVNRMYDNRYLRLARFNLDWIMHRQVQELAPKLTIPSDTS